MGVYNKSFDCITDAVVTHVGIFPPVEYTPGKPLPASPYITENAMWDTGASLSAISRKLIDVLHLEPYSKAMVSSLHDAKLENTYLVHLLLPTTDTILDVECTEAHTDDYDFVCGMNVIGYSDFFISNFEDKTSVAIRIPSNEKVQL